MRRVFLMGAGASCAYDASPTGIAPPLASGMIAAYNSLSISGNRYVLVGELVNYIRDTRGIHPVDFDYWDENIEEFFTEIANALSKLALKKRRDELTVAEFPAFFIASKLKNQLVFLLASILNEIQNGPVCESYRVFADSICNDDTIITFNWDTLLDRALASTGRWSPERDYGAIPHAIFDDGWRASRGEDTPPAPLLLKLHGSTNWLMPYQNVNLQSGILQSLSEQSHGKFFVYLNASRPYETYRSRYWGPYAPFSYCYYPPNLPADRDDDVPGHTRYAILSAADLPDHGDLTTNDPCVYSMPLIVPPELHKNYELYGDTLTGLWQQADNAIARCDELFIIGYSFPDTDTESRRLIARSLCRNSQLGQIVVVDPSPSRVVGVLRDIFHVPDKLITTLATPFAPKDGTFEHILRSHR